MKSYCWIIQNTNGQEACGETLIDSTAVIGLRCKLSKHLKGMQSLEAVAKTNPLKFKIKADGYRQQALFG